MEILKSRELSLEKLFDEARKLELSNERLISIREMLFCVDNSSEKNHEIVRKFYDLHPHYRGLGRDYYDYERLTCDEKYKLVEYLSFLIDSITQWSGDKTEFSQLCQLISIYNWSGNFWNVAICKISMDKQWFNICKEVLYSITPQVLPRPFENNPISFESENTRFKVFEHNQDWEGIANYINLSEPSFLPPIFRESVRCLYSIRYDDLLNICNDVKSSILAVVYSNCLSNSEALSLAKNTTSKHVRFIFVYLHINNATVDSVYDDVFSIFLNVSRDNSEWSKWLSVFNKYPVRFQNLQSVLGRVLSNVSKDALESYVNSVDLRIHPSKERELVSRCLSVFRELATKEQRHYLWKLAYARWVKWNFDLENEKNLMDISQSSLDYALVGYFIEVDSEPMDSYVDKLFERLNAVSDAWHSSSVSMISACKREFSHFQPIAHANSVITTSADWYCPDGQHYTISFNEDCKSYMKMLGFC